MKKLILITLAMGVAAVLWSVGGCCKACSKAPTDLIPGMKDSGLPDPNAVKEHEAEIETLSKEIEKLAEEQQRIAADSTLSPEEKQRRLEELQKQMQPKVERMAQLGGDILNRETEVNKAIEEGRKGAGGK